MNKDVPTGLPATPKPEPRHAGEELAPAELYTCLSCIADTDIVPSDPSCPDCRGTCLVSRPTRRRQERAAKMRLNYHAYLDSPAWRTKRSVALVYYGRTCARCHRDEAAIRRSGLRLEIHHRHYRTFGDESMEDLEVLCTTCHARADQERAGA